MLRGGSFNSGAASPALFDRRQRATAGGHSRSGLPCRPPEEDLTHFLGA